MSVAAISWAFDQSISDTTTKLLLVTLADFADDENACWPSQSLLSERVGNCSVDTIQRHVKKLEAEGYLTRERRHLSNGNRTSDRYVLNAPRRSRKMRSSGRSTKPQNAVLSKPHPDAASSTPHNCAVANRTVKVEPPVVVSSRRKVLGETVEEDTGGGSTWHGGYNGGGADWVADWPADDEVPA